MTKELEIEFKNLLTHEEYTRLLAVFGHEPNDAVKQVNYYFDTADFRLRQQNSALRVREKKNGYECTLKTPAENGFYEITDTLAPELAEELITLQSFPAEEVASVLREMAVQPEELMALGTLTTYRIEFPYEGGLLVFDHSDYPETEDFELEFEVTDYEEGKKIFSAFLEEYRIPTRITDKKIARFMTAVNQGHTNKIIE